MLGVAPEGRVATPEPCGLTQKMRQQEQLSSVNKRAIRAGYFLYSLHQLLMSASPAGRHFVVTRLQKSSVLGDLGQQQRDGEEFIQKDSEKFVLQERRSQPGRSAAAAGGGQGCGQE